MSISDLRAKAAFANWITNHFDEAGRGEVRDLFFWFLPTHNPAINCCHCLRHAIAFCPNSLEFAYHMSFFVLLWDMIMIGWDIIHNRSSCTCCTYFPFIKLQALHMPVLFFLKLSKSYFTNICIKAVLPSRRIITYGCSKLKHSINSFRIVPLSSEHHVTFLKTGIRSFAFEKKNLHFIYLIVGFTLIS